MRIVDRRLVARGLVAAVIVVHMQIGALYEQILEVRRPPLTMTWRMYAGPGKDVCEVEWWAHDRRTGELVAVDRLAALGHDPFWKAPAPVKRQHSKDEVVAAAGTLCKALPGMDIRARARCAVRSRWRDVLAPDEPLCQRSAPRGRSPRP